MMLGAWSSTISLTIPEPNLSPVTDVTTVTLARVCHERHECHRAFRGFHLRALVKVRVMCPPDSGLESLPVNSPSASIWASNA